MTLFDETTPDIQPGNDFYRYVNDRWMKANPIPDDKARVGAFTVLGDENTERLHALLEASPEPNESEGIAVLRHFYQSAMDEAAIEAAGLEPVQSILDQVRAVNDPAAVLDLITSEHSVGRSLVWRPFVEPDDKDSSRLILRLAQSGLGLPDRDYYLEGDERFQAILNAYRDFLTQLFELLGDDQPATSATAVIALETELARASMTATQCRDVDAMYNPYSLNQLQQEFPGLDWRRYLERLSASNVTEIFVSQPAFVSAAFELITQRTPAEWRSYLTFHAIADLLPKLPAAFADVSFDFYGRTLSGATEPEPRYRRVIKLCAQVLPEPLGELYVAHHFDESAKVAISQLVSTVTAALGRRIDALDWMSDATKAAAQRKLATFLPLLGYPDTWKSFESLKLQDAYVTGYLQISAFEWGRDASRLGGPVDRYEWLMSPATVNAYYWANTNGITFPAAILQPPFFDAAGDFAANYGGIGVVIGHEITHGFDDKGSKFDAEGNLNSWWTAEDRAAFEARAGGLRDQFARYEVEGRPVNGELTLGENIADLGGLLVAYEAMRSYLEEHPEARAEIDGFSPEQRFFMSYARVWRGNIRPELALEFLVRDPHAPARFRTNGGVVNVDAWYEAFEVTPNHGLYVAPEARIRIW